VKRKIPSCKFNFTFYNCTTYTALFNRKEVLVTFSFRYSIGPLGLGSDSSQRLRQVRIILAPNGMVTIDSIVL